ncbi:DNA cytosine methyltransferase [Streptomyces sp. NPDC006283]|uniref:DNA cytosine methyltransferase n=1 Tax=Streptomyces sp. NPDC006283 TaxID=3156741 RepID=UPI0033AAC7DA
MQVHTQRPLAAAMSCVEICAGGGGQALGLEQAGFTHRMLVELDSDACSTLRSNRPQWRVLRSDVREVAADSLCTPEGELHLFAGGVPCPPFSLAGRQLGAGDERDLFPAALSLIAGLRPKAVLLENVKGLLQSKFDGYRGEIVSALADLGYMAEWRLLYARDYGVPQLRPRAILVALAPPEFARFRWPTVTPGSTPLASVGSALRSSMGSRGWELADHWAEQAQQIAPTLCGGSRKHGGPDLGPSRARRAWAAMGVNGSSVADLPPGPGAQLPIRLTVAQIALLQGFPPDWQFSGRKTSVYRQVGNAFPPPFAEAVGKSIASALTPAEDVPMVRTASVSCGLHPVP